MSEPRNLLEERFGSLIVKREQLDGTLFCICQPEQGSCFHVTGMGTRTVTRRQLTTKAIQSCGACAVAHKLMSRPGKGGKVFTEAPEPKPQTLPEPVCKGCVKDGEFLWAQPDCPTHGIATLPWNRKNNASIGGGRTYISHRKGNAA